MCSRHMHQAATRLIKRGFTFIEILVALSLLGLLFVPMMQFFSHSIEATRDSRDLMTAVSLARWEMERIKNLAINMDQVRDLAGTAWPAPTDPPLLLNDQEWRLDRLIDATTPLKITIHVRIEGTTEPVAQLSSLLAETSWTQQQ